jgi:photosynthetic reaction center H subunit
MKSNPAVYIDWAQITLYVFWAFFAGLIYYLHRESKREGYPLQPSGKNRKPIPGFMGMPGPKTFILPHGGEISVPRADDTDHRALNAKPAAPWPGAPLVPTGNPMADGVGPAAWAERSTSPDLTMGGEPRIVPMASTAGYEVAHRDPDPRGMNVVGADGKVGGVVTDVWVDRSECLIRYFEVKVAGGGQHVLLPVNFTRVNSLQRQVTVASILGGQFAGVPVTQSKTQVTRREEDQICGYYGGGTLYATPMRAEPLL